VKKFLGLTLAILLLVAVAAPPADAGWSRGGHGRWEGGSRQEYRGSGGCPACGFLGGVILGGVLGGVLAAPAFGPPPVYAAPPLTCHTQPGYWTQVPVASSGVYTTYRNVWVAPQRVCQ
jgi:hypothetical protein